MAKKKPAPAPDIEVLPADTTPDPETQQLTTATGQLQTFLGSMARFITGATELEKRAKEQLDIAKQLKAPTNGDEDAHVQVVIRNAKLTRKQIDEHWGIAQVVHGIHRMMTARREKGGQLADQAAQTAQTLHNRYVDEQNRKAREETERLRREAVAREEEERAREQERLEAEAVKREEASTDLSEREKAFVDFLVLDIHAGTTQGNPQRAAERAGYRDALKTAARLTSSPKIQAAVKAKQEAEAIRKQAAARKNRPSEVHVEPVRPDISRAPGSFDRSTYSAEVFDVDQFMAALLDPVQRTRLGIPADIATFQQTKLNEHARDLKELMNKWPGVRAVKKTTTV